MQPSFAKDVTETEFFVEEDIGVEIFDKLYPVLQNLWQYFDPITFFRKFVRNIIFRKTFYRSICAKFVCSILIRISSFANTSIAVSFANFV